MKGKRLIIVHLLSVTTLVLLTDTRWLDAQDQLQPGRTRRHYVVRDLGTLGGSISTATGINDWGAVVGSANTRGDRSSRAFVWRDGNMTDLGTLGGTNSQVQWPGTDNRGLVVGSAEISALDPYNEDFCGFDSNSGVPPTGLICLGFLWRDGDMSALPTLGGNNAQAIGVNNVGQVAGFSETATRDPNCAPPQIFDVKPVIWGPEPGDIHSLAPLPGDLSAWAIGINDSGQVVGDSGACVTPNFNGPNGVFLRHAAIWEKGEVSNLGTLGGTFANVGAINSKGQVVGHSTLPGDSTVHAFVWENGVMKDLGVVAGDFLSVGVRPER